MTIEETIFSVSEIRLQFFALNKPKKQVFFALVTHEKSYCGWRSIKPGQKPRGVFHFHLKKKKKKSLSNSIDSLRTVELENQKSGDRRVLPQQHWTLNVCTHFLFEFYYLQLSLLIRKCVFKMKRVCTVWKYFFPRLFIKTCKHLSKMYKIFNQVDAESQDNTAI